jgi:hypothetical protein
MAKAAPSKKTAKAVKASTGDKKKRRATRHESYGSYIYKVLKQVHPGMFHVVTYCLLRTYDTLASLLAVPSVCVPELRQLTVILPLVHIYFFHLQKLVSVKKPWVS